MNLKITLPENKFDFNECPFCKKSNIEIEISNRYRGNELYITVQCLECYFLLINLMLENAKFHNGKIIINGE